MGRGRLRQRVRAVDDDLEAAGRDVGDEVPDHLGARVRRDLGAEEDAGERLVAHAEHDERRAAPDPDRRCPTVIARPR